ncbi:MAG TPA: NAD(P)-dependent oxidoreductase [Nitrososphaerales archaeon]|nr:NAD(P)-dependent oxidoreductase [Nitrososphaerales archaeon]
MPLEAREVLSAYDVYEQEADDVSLATCRALLTWPSRPKGDLLRKLKGLRMIQSLAAGVDALDFTSVPAGVEVFSNAGAYTETAAEHAWGLALGIAKGINAGRKRLPPRHLRSKTLLVVGCGAIGSEVARLARASLEMATIGVSRSYRQPELFDERRRMEDLAEAVGRADLLVNALPLTRATRSIFDYQVLSNMKPTVIVVNIGRGETMDEGAVMKWLTERPESRYATDVFWKPGGRENFDSPLWDLPNFGGTMHTASAQDPEAIVRAQVAAAENVKRFLETGSALNRVKIEEYLP